LATNLFRRTEWHFLQNSLLSDFGETNKNKKPKHQNFSFSFQKFAVFRLVYVFLVHNVTNVKNDENRKFIITVNKTFFWDYETKLNLVFEANIFFKNISRMRNRSVLTVNLSKNLEGTNS
jgi:hypothetical protein